MRKRLLVVLTLALLTLLVGTVASLSREQSGSDESATVATPVQEGVLTGQQKEHSKLYDSYKGHGKISKLVQKQNELTVTINPPLPVLSPGGRQTDSLNTLVDKADAILIGSVTDKTSQITTNGTFVFTDYQ